MTRLATPKTYKVYLNGAFARSESGRHASVEGKSKNINVPLCSRKDVRNAVQGSGKVQGSWAGRTGFNRGQILYRIAEMLDGRSAQFEDELVNLGASPKQAKEEVEKSIDRCIYYAGWCDKYQAISGTVNPVSSSHFNFSMPEARGVLGLVSNSDSHLLGPLSVILPALAGGNAVLILVPSEKSTAMLCFAEVLHTSDLPGGVVQILSGDLNEMSVPLAGHLDLEGLILDGEIDNITLLEEEASENLKRVCHYQRDWKKEKSQGLSFITDLQEFKTTWHPIEKSAGKQSSY